MPLALSEATYVGITTLITSTLSTQRLINTGYYSNCNIGIVYLITEPTLVFVLCAVITL